MLNESVHLTLLVTRGESYALPNVRKLVDSVKLTLFVSRG